MDSQGVVRPVFVLCASAYSAILNCAMNLPVTPQHRAHVEEDKRRIDRLNLVSTVAIAHLRQSIRQ
jgi:hypothetical protein